MDTKTSEKININEVSKDAIVKELGLSSAQAQKIIDYRLSKGPFKSYSDLNKIPGLSKSSSQKLASNLSFNADNQKFNFTNLSQHSASRLKFNLKLPDKISEDVKISFGNTSLLDKNQKPLSALNLNYPVFENQLPDLRVKIPLSRYNPPGTHTLEMTVNGVKQKVNIDIDERISVQITPNQFYIENAAGSNIEKEIFITNMGNLPLQLKDPGAVMLESEFLECRMVRDAVHQIRSKKFNIDELLNAFADKLGNLYEEAGAMKIKFDKQSLLAPGERIKVKLKIQLPKGLKPTQKYYGTYRLYDATIKFNIQ